MPILPHQRSRNCGAAELTKAGWAESVHRMMELGAPVTPAEAGVLVNYLTANFGPAPAKPPASKIVVADAKSLVLADPEKASFAPITTPPGGCRGGSGRLPCLFRAHAGYPTRQHRTGYLRKRRPPRFSAAPLKSFRILWPPGVRTCDCSVFLACCRSRGFLGGLGSDGRHREWQSGAAAAFAPEMPNQGWQAGQQFS